MDAVTHSLELHISILCSRCATRQLQQKVSIRCNGPRRTYKIITNDLSVSGLRVGSSVLREDCYSRQIMKKRKKALVGNKESVGCYYKCIDDMEAQLKYSLECIQTLMWLGVTETGKTS